MHYVYGCDNCTQRIYEKRKSQKRRRRKRRRKLTWDEVKGRDRGWSVNDLLRIKQYLRVGVWKMEGKR